MCSSAVPTGAVLEVLEPPCITSADQLGHPRLATDPKPQKDVGPYNRESVTCATSKKVLPARRPAQKEITYSSSGSETSLSVTPTLTRSLGTDWELGKKTRNTTSYIFSREPVSTVRYKTTLGNCRTHRSQVFKYFEYCNNNIFGVILSTI